MLGDGNWSTAFVQKGGDISEAAGKPLPGSCGNSEGLNDSPWGENGQTEGEPRVSAAPGPFSAASGSVRGAHTASLWLHRAGEAPEGAWSDGQGGSVPHVWPLGRAMEAGRRLRPSLHVALWASSSHGGLGGSRSRGLASPGQELHADPCEGHKAP